ncbi:MAG TPA: hypothetical protein VFU13_14870 [Steroidobacteraceae bacterium]|nr:hypothetical protein [Steroidobacteraceae bacterium]
MLNRIFALFAVAFALTTAALAADPAPLTATFVGIKSNAMGEYGVYTLKNVSGKDIDDIAMALTLKDKDGNTMSTIAVSDTTPGLVWLKAGGTIQEGVPLDGRRGAKELLEKRIGESQLVIEVQSIKYLK